MIRFCFLLPFLLTGHLALAQANASFVFSHYQPLKGLASHETNDVVEDGDGFLWVATNNGLQRFDGVKFKTFRHREGDTTSIPSNIIIRLAMDRQNHLFLITQKGEVAMFDVRRFTCRRIPVQLNRPLSTQGNDTRFFSDADGNLFLVIRGYHPAMYDSKRGEFLTASSIFPLPAQWAVTAIAQQPGTKNYWIGLHTGGLAVYNPATRVLSYYGNNREREPLIDTLAGKRIISHIRFDQKGRFWFEEWIGSSTVLQYDPKQGTKRLQAFEFVADLKTYYEVHNILAQRDGRLWVSGLQVLAYYDEEKSRFVHVRGERAANSGIEYEEINKLYEDREQNIWVATQNNGLHRFNPTTEVFTNISHPPRDPEGIEGRGAVMSFVQTRNGDILCGTWEDGMFRYNTGLEEVPLGVSLPKGQSMRYAYAWSLCASADSNTIWIGAQPGVGQYDQAAQTAYFRNPPALENHTVRQVVEDKTGTLWLGLQRFGVFRWINPKSKVSDSLVRVREVGHQLINRMMVDRRGWVWIGTSVGGLFVYDGRTARLLKYINGDQNKDASLPGSAISALLDYDDSLVLVGNMERLFLYNRNTDRFAHFTALPAFLGNITAMEKDGAGYVWASTTNALYRLRPGSKGILVNNRLSGITNDRFNLASSYKLRDGRLLFGAGNIFVAFDPAKANTYQAAVPIHITGLALGKQELLTDSVLQLDRLETTSRNNSLTVDFSPLTFGNTYAVEYMIEGVDEGWQVADRNFRISYPFLPTGRFTLKLRAFNPAGPDAPLTTLNIWVKPPWYQTWWFYALVVIAFVTELWWLDRQRNQRKRTLQKMRTDISDNLHEEINTALSNINILSEIARLKSDREPQKAKEYLEQIHTKSQNMMVAMDDMLWSLDPENDAMAKTVSRIREYTDALMQRHGVKIEMLIDKRVERMELNMRVRHEAFLLFKEGLRCLVEAGTGLCIVHVTADKGKLLFTIEFENEGCDMQQLNNLLHRRDMALRLEALKAKLDVQVHKSRSMFLLQLPLGQ